jgi:hypothetical protein
MTTDPQQKDVEESVFLFGSGDYSLLGYPGPPTLQRPSAVLFEANIHNIPTTTCVHLNATHASKTNMTKTRIALGMFLPLLPLVS